MDLVDHFRTLLAWDAWANRETVRSLGATADPGAVRLLAHIAASKRLWLNRTVGDASPVVVWPDLPLAAASDALRDIEAEWGVWLARLRPEGLAPAVSYVNSKGEAWSSTVAQILTHMAAHSHYHRGQIAARVRAAGGEPAYTDFIHAIRTRALKTEEVPSD